MNQIPLAFIIVVTIAVILLAYFIWSTIKGYPEQKANLAEAKEAFGRLLAGLSDTATDEQKKNTGEAIAFLRGQLPFQKVFTFEHCVVTYEPRALHYKKEKVEETLAAILKAHPDADLTKHEQALGIKIIDVQRKGSSSQPTHDMPVGEWE